MTTNLKFNKQYMVIRRGFNTSSCYAVIYGKESLESLEINLYGTLMFIYKQKINHNSNFFFDILQRHCKLAVLGTLGMLDHPNQNHSINL